MNATISIARAGQELGAWGVADIHKMLQAGVLTPADHFWQEGMPEWASLESFVPPQPATIIFPITGEIVQQQDSLGSTPSATRAVPGIATPAGLAVPVALDPPLLKSGRHLLERCMACLADALIASGGFMLMFVAVALSPGHTPLSKRRLADGFGGNMAVAHFVALVALVAGLAYFLLRDGLPYGGFGKQLFGLMVTDPKSKSRCSYGKSLVRNIFSLIPYVEIPCLLFSANARRLGDHLAGTLVVKREEATGHARTQFRLDDSQGEEISNPLAVLRPSVPGDNPGSRLKNRSLVGAGLSLALLVSTGWLITGWSNRHSAQAQGRPSRAAYERLLTQTHAFLGPDGTVIIQDPAGAKLSLKIDYWKASDGGPAMPFNYELQLFYDHIDILREDDPYCSQSAAEDGMEFRPGAQLRLPDAPDPSLSGAIDKLVDWSVASAQLGAKPQDDFAGSNDSDSYFVRCEPREGYFYLMVHNHRSFASLQSMQGATALGYISPVTSFGRAHLWRYLINHYGEIRRLAEERLSEQRTRVPESNHP